MGRRGAVGGACQPVDQRAVLACSGGQLPSRREPVGMPADDRRRVGVDVVGLRRVSGLPLLPLPGIQRGVLRIRVQSPARGFLGDASHSHQDHVPQLGLSDQAPDLLRLPLCEGRVIGSVRVDAFLTGADLDAALRADVACGLTSVPKELPPKWFYDELGSQLFDEITRLEEYYPTRREREILEAHAPDVAACGADTLVELGSGTAEKTRLLLRVVNRRLGADFVPSQFAHVARFDKDNEWIEMLLRSEVDQSVHVPALELTVQFASGEEMRTEISAKFRRSGVESELRAAGLRLVEWWTDRQGDFAVSLSVRG